MKDTFWFLSDAPDINKVAFPYILRGGDGNSCAKIGCGVYDFLDS